MLPHGATHQDTADHFLAGQETILARLWAVCWVGFLVQFLFQKNLWLFFWGMFWDLCLVLLRPFVLWFCWEDAFFGMFKPSKIIKDTAFLKPFFVDYPAALLTTFLLLHFFFGRIYLPVSETLHGWISWGFKQKQPDTPQSHREKVKPVVTKPSKTTWDVSNLVNNGINYQPQMVQDFFHQQTHLNIGDHLVQFHPADMVRAPVRLDHRGTNPGHGHPFRVVLNHQIGRADTTWHFAMIFHERETVVETVQKLRTVQFNPKGLEKNHSLFGGGGGSSLINA